MIAIEWFNKLLINFTRVIRFPTNKIVNISAKVAFNYEIRKYTKIKKYSKRKNLNLLNIV